MGKTVFIDVFLILLLQVMMLLMFAILIMGKVESEETPVIPTEYMITYTWENEDLSDDAIDKRGSDVDGWIQRNLDPNTLCMFRRREVDVFTLHNDNVGSNYGAVDGKRLKQAFEIITINSKDENFYQFSLQGYRVDSSVEPLEVVVKVEQVSPYKLIYTGLHDVYDGEETKVVAFEVNEQGGVSNIETKPELLSNLWR